MPDHPLIVRRRSLIHGHGVFATVPIPRGQEIVDYTGRLITHAEADLRYGNLDSGHTFLFTLNPQWVVDANEDGNVARWINASCAPNCVARIIDDPAGDPRAGRIVITASRAIVAGEELTYDYDVRTEEPITPSERLLWACRCGAVRCRGILLKHRPRRRKRPRPSLDRQTR